ncbi:MAG: extracellular solute-binding protein [Proteobacteria bacterium]|nr:extracellular solute-binding protein [Pseudomonadota bacterium]
MMSTRSSWFSRARSLRRHLQRLAVLAAAAVLWTSPPAGAEVIRNAGYDGERTVIRWTFWGGERTVRTYREVAARFVARHPDIAVDVVILPWGQYWTKLQTQAASGLAPDVISLVSASAGVWINHGALLPLDDFVARSGLDLTQYYRGAVDSMRWSGRQYALPIEVAAGAVVYSIDRLEELGIPQEEWPPADRPMNWRDFKALARQLTLRDERGNVVQYGIGSGGWWSDILFGLYGGTFVDRRVNPTRPDIAGDEALVRALIEVFQLMHAERVQAPASVFQTSDYSGDQVLRSNQFAMAYHGPYVLETLRENGVRVGITPIPAGDVPIQSVSVNAVGIYRDSEHPDEAWEFVRFLASPDAQAVITNTLRSVPVSRLAEGAFIDNAYGIEGVEAFLYDIERARPFLAPAATYVERAYLTWLERLDFALDYEYERRLRAMQARHDVIDDATYTAFVDEMRGVVERRIRSELPVLEADLLSGFARMQRQDGSAGSRVLMPILLVSLFGAAFLLYLRYVRRQEGSTRAMASAATNLAAFVCLSPWLFGFAFFTLGPIVASVYLSFTEWNMISEPVWVGARHYRDLFSDKYFLIGLERTVRYAAFVIPISLFGGIATAGLLTSNVRGADSFKAIFYFPSLFTGAAAAVLWVNMFHKEYGIVNRILSTFGVLPINWLDEYHAFYTVVLMNVFWIGGATIIYYAGMKQIPRTLYEAAEIDGAGTVRRFFSITLPMLSPVILFMVIMTTIGAFQVFTPALFFVDNPSQVGGPGDSLRFYAVNIYDEAFNNLHMGKACAWAFVLFVIIFAVTMIQIKLSKRFVYTET